MGLSCICGTRTCDVIDSRQGGGDEFGRGRYIRRRRKCVACGRKFTTYEVELSRPSAVLFTVTRNGGLLVSQYASGTVFERHRRIGAAIEEAIREVIDSRRPETPVTLDETDEPEMTE